MIPENKLPQNLKTYREHLKSYYGQLGFHSGKDCPYMLMPLEELGPKANDLDLPDTVHIPPQIAKNEEGP